MEEIGNTEAIQKEILDEARKTAEKVLREADEEVERTRSASSSRAKNAQAEVAKAADTWIGRYRAETLARLPLEKIRFKTDLIDRRIRRSLSAYIAGLGEERIASLVESLMRDSLSQFKGSEVDIRFKGLSQGRAVVAAKNALGVSGARKAAEDQKLPSVGLVVESIDGKLTLRATMDLVESDLLDRQRGELAQALCAEALKA
ncbi:MAG: hypothetical protein WCL50_01680 [Spirochaetota bacterium]